MRTRIRRRGGADRCLSVLFALCLAFVALMLPAHRAEAQITYMGKLLPSLVMGKPAFAYGINGDGIVVGKAAAADGSFHAVVWTPPAYDITDIGTCMGGQSSAGYAINDNSPFQITGTADDPGAGGEFRAYEFDISRFDWAPIPPLPGGHYAAGLSINTALHAVGYSTADKNGVLNPHGFYWDGSAITEIPFAGKVESLAHSLTEPHSLLVQQSGREGWEPGSGLPGAVVRPTIPDDGVEEVVGEFGRDLDRLGFYWKVGSGQALDLGTLSGDKRSIAYAITKDGQFIVGLSGRQGAMQAVYWQNFNPNFPITAIDPDTRNTTALAVTLSITGTDPPIVVTGAGGNISDQHALRWDPLVGRFQDLNDLTQIGAVLREATGVTLDIELRERICGNATRGREQIAFVLIQN